MLFYGPPGTGKTSTILALAKELFGPELSKSRVLELNASDERGISIVREKVKDFARVAISNVPAATKKKYPCPPYKLIILDEADSMTHDAQSALRRTMETYSKITRFCLICNYVTRIIDPLASRCSKFRFKPLDEGSAMERLEYIAREEKVDYEPGVMDALIRVSDGDLRKAITFLQSAARLHNPVAPPPEEQKMRDDSDDEMEGVEVSRPVIEKTPITIRSIEEIAGVIPDATIDHLISTLEPRARGQSTYPQIARAIEDMVADGWSASQVLLQMYQRLAFDDAIAAAHKAKIVGVFSEVDKRLADGADEHLQMLDLGVRISGILAEK